MSIITKSMKQTAVYWGPPVEDYDGGHAYPDPVEIRCRWTSVEGEMMDPVSHDTTDKSSVFVSQDVVKDGYLYLGDLASVESENPATLKAAKKIVGFAKIPNLKNTEYLRVAMV
jgi:hypothetical protein